MREARQGHVPDLQQRRASLRGRKRYTGQPLYYPRVMMRTLAQVLTEEYSEHGVHVANIVINGLIDSPGIKRYRDRPEAARGDDEPREDRRGVLLPPHAGPLGQEPRAAADPLRNEAELLARGLAPNGAYGASPIAAGAPTPSGPLASVPKLVTMSRVPGPSRASRARAIRTLSQRRPSRRRARSTARAGPLGPPHPCGSWCARRPRWDWASTSLSTNDPPHPPQKHAPGGGERAHLVGQSVADAVPQRLAHGRVDAVALFTEDRAGSSAGDRSRTPKASPPWDTAAWIRAIERAFPWPLAAGISARRHGVVHDQGRVRRPVPPGSHAAMLPGSASAPGWTGGGITLASGGRARRAADVEVGAERPRHLLGEELPRLRPVTRRTTSPSRNPWVKEWYPAALPGGHRGACAATAPSPTASRRGPRPSARASPGGRRCAGAGAGRATVSLPLAANSGQYRATGAARGYRHGRRGSRAHRAVMVLVTTRRW